MFRCHSKNALWCNISDRHSQNLAVIWLHYSVLLYGSRHHHHPLSITPFVLGAEQSVPIEESSRQADNHRQRKQVNVVGRESERRNKALRRKSEKDRKRDLSLFSLYPHRKTTTVSKGAAILAPSFTQVHGSRIFDSQCIVSKCVAICCFARALFCGSHLHITTKQQSIITQFHI